MAKTLFVTDFDDTLAQTDANVIVTNAGKTKNLTPAEYAVYEPQQGDQFDFSEFDQLKNPKPIKRFVNLLKHAMNGKADKVVILTARKHTRPVAQFLKMQGITSGVVIAALGDNNPEKKAHYIEKQIQDGFDRVLFVDDSPKNISAVNTLKAKHPQAKILVHHAQEIQHSAPASTPKEEPESAGGSDISKKAKELGLSYMGFGRYGKDKKVTHIVQNSTLVPKQHTR